MAINVVGGWRWLVCSIEVGHHLVTVEIEVDPAGRGPAFFTPENPTVEVPSRRKVIDGDSKVEAGPRHGRNRNAVVDGVEDPRAEIEK